MFRTRSDSGKRDFAMHNSKRWMIPQGGSNMRTCLLTVTALADALTVPAAFAQQQQPQTQRVSGTIERVDGNSIYGKGLDGSAITLKLTDNVAVTAVLKATFADIKPGDYVGTGGVAQADG